MRNDWHDERLAPLGILLAVLCALLACSDQKATKLCSTNEDCGENEVCINGACRPTCTTSEDCPKGYNCISGACLKPCQEDGDCPSGEECRDGYCAPKPKDDGGQDGDGGSACIDEDQDGYFVNCGSDLDCDDTDRLTHPNASEICGDGKDNDCDGTTDESDCGCDWGMTQACYSGPAGTSGVGICHPGIRVCHENREFGPCTGEQLPEDEVCDGLDNDCDGETDEGLLNACGTCGELPIEQCGDSLDNDCDGEIDENCDCDPNCHCEEGGAGLECTCHPPTHQPCYSGPPGTLGIGRCHGGYHDCVESGGAYVWSTCEGEVLPGIECENGAADGEDNDCDGAVDEDCLPDSDGDGFAPPEDCNDSNPDIHPGALETCNGLDDNCNGLVDEGVTNACGECGEVPEEVCADGLDNDCDGMVDEGCGGCSGSETKVCYRGPDGTQGVGQCREGLMECIGGELWGPCEGDVLPEPEICDELDNDCDGETDEQWAIGSNACGWCDDTELCDNIDNDCDGLTDEGQRNSCGQCIYCDPQNSDCPEKTVCDPVLQVCSETECDGVDNDCDGLTDEGLLNACGTCGESCYQQEWGGEDDWPKGTSDGVSNSVNPDELRLDSTTQSPHYIWVAGTHEVCNSASGCDTNPPCYSGTTCHTVRKYDTHTDTLIGKYSSWGWSPSRTAVAVDNSVWVGNRGCENILSNCDATNPIHGNAAHLDADGNLICRADVTGSGVAVRAVTIDQDGNAWLGSWGGGKIYKYSGSDVDNTNPDGVPRCVQMLEVDLQGSYAYGAAVDGNGYLWISTLGSGQLRKINTANGQIVMSVNPGMNTYGIAIDQNNNVWYGNWTGGSAGVIRVNGTTGAIDTFGRSVGDTGAGQSRGVAVDQDGNVWVAEWTHNTVSKFAPNGAHLGQYPVAGLGVNASGPLGMAIDFDNNIWTINYGSGHASKFDANGNLLNVFPVGSDPYTYSDMTGYQLRTITLKHGTWTLDFDSGYEDAQWDTIEWSGTMGQDDDIRVRARTAATQGDLFGASWSPYHDADPAVAPPWRADISTEVPVGRWLQVQVILETDDEVSPAFTGLKVFWQR